MKEKYSPMMMQYLGIKEQNKDSIVMFRLGDFYEMFFDDAIMVSKELELALTGKNAGAKERVPMCGVPFHSASGYIQRLVDNGHKVAIVEQLTDPGKKGIVERGVVQIVTPGTIFDESLTQNRNNYIACMMTFDFVYTLAFCDITTGEFQVVNIDKQDNILNNQLATMEIKEIVVESNCTYSFHEGIMVSRYDNETFNEKYQDIFKNIKDLKQIKLSVERWDTKQKDFSVQAVRFGTGSGCVSEFGQNWEFISYKENLQTVQKKNPSYFVELTDYLDENHTKYKAARYFKNNNSYVLYERSEKGKKHNYLCLENQMLTLEYPKYMIENQKYISFPYPSCKSLSDFKIEESWEKNEDFYEKEFWQLYSYEDLKAFYQNFEKGTAECSDKTQTILVKAMEHDYDNKTSDASVLLDFKNHNFIVKNPQGKKIFDKNDVWKAYEKQYTSAGKFGSKEFFYNKSSVNILCVEKGKRTVCIENQDVRDTLFEDLGWNCVGTSMDMKVSPKSNSKNIYLDVTLHMEEDGKWDNHAVLKLDKDGKFVECK